MTVSRRPPGRSGCSSGFYQFNLAAMLYSTPGHPDRLGLRRALSPSPWPAWQGRRPGPPRGSPGASAEPTADRHTGLGAAGCLLHEQTLKSPGKLLFIRFSRELKPPSESAWFPAPGELLRAPPGPPHHHTLTPCLAARAQPSRGRGCG